MLAKNPVFATIALLTLSVGIASATVVFSAINALLLKPIPLVRDEGRLLHVESRTPHQVEETGFSFPDLRDLRQRMTTLEAAWGYHDRTVMITGINREAERLLGSTISIDAFHHLGVQPMLGRNFVPGDEAASAPEAVLLSYSLWQRRFGGDESVIGSSIQLNQSPAVIIGVMPRGWGYPELSDLWTPLRPEDEKEDRRGYLHLTVHAKMKPGVALPQVQAEVDTVMSAIAVESPLTNEGVTAVVRPLREVAIEDSAQLTLLLFGSVMFVFLIACLNVANLVLARAGTRAREFALRLALGAERKRLVQQLITESVVLGVLGGVGGLVLGLWGVDLMVATLPVDIPFWLRFQFDGRVFVFVFFLSLLASGIFGILPALRNSRQSLTDAIKEGGRTSNQGNPRSQRLRHGLVVTEIALALVLLVGAGLMMRSFLELRRVEPGFEANNVLTFRAGYPASMSADPATLREFFGRLSTQLSSLPEVESAAAVSYLPGTAAGMGALQWEGTAEPTRLRDAPTALGRVVTPGFFQTLQIPLIRGRTFTEQDQPEGPPVAIVDAAFARKYFGSEDAALGRRFRPFEDTDKDPKWVEIVGVVGSIRHRWDRNDFLPTFYTPHAQEPTNFMSVVVRTRVPPEQVIEAARNEVTLLDRELAIYHVFSLEQVLLRSVWPRFFFSRLFTVFAGIALFLACIGIYGIMSYSVTQRTQEIGVRVALGAEPHSVVRLIVQQGLRLVGVGLVVGLVAAAAFARLLAGNLYGVSPHDPPTFALVPALLAGVALLACYLPSRHATRIDPIHALRSD